MITFDDDLSQCAFALIEHEDEEEVKHIFVRNIIHHLIWELDDKLYGNTKHKEVRDKEPKFDNVYSIKFSEAYTKYFDEVDRTLYDIEEKVDKEMHNIYYDKIWHDFDKLPFDDVYTLEEAIDDRVNPLTFEILDYLKANFEYFQK